MVPPNRTAAHNALLRGVLHDGPSTSLVPVWLGRPQQPTPESFSFLFSAVFLLYRLVKQLI